MDLQRFSGLIAIQQAIATKGGGLQAALDAIVDERSVMPQANGVVIELRDAISSIMPPPAVPRPR